MTRASGATRLPDRLKCPISSMRRSTTRPISLAIGHRHARPAARASGPTSWPGRCPGFSSSTGSTRPIMARLKSTCWRVEQGLQALQPLVLHRFRHLVLHRGAGRAGPGAVFERIGLGEADLLDQRQGRREIRLALAREADDEIRRQRDVRPRGRAAGRRSRRYVRAVCWRFIASSTRSEPDCTGRCRNGISCGTSPCAAIRSSSMSRGCEVV